MLHEHGAALCEPLLYHLTLTVLEECYFLLIDNFNADFFQDGM